MKSTLNRNKLIVIHDPDNIKDPEVFLTDGDFLIQLFNVSECNLSYRRDDKENILDPPEIELIFSDLEVENYLGDPVL